FTFYGPDATLKQLGIWLSRNTDSYPPALITISLTLLFSYIIAVLLGGMRWISIKLIPLYYRRWVRRKPAEEVTDKERQFSLRYDFIRHKSPSAGNRISKLGAESMMANTLVAGFVPLTIINLWLYLSNGNKYRAIGTILFLLISIASFGARRYFDFYRD